MSYITELESLKVKLQHRENTIVHAVTQWNACKERVKSLKEQLARSNENVVNLKNKVTDAIKDLQDQVHWRAPELARDTVERVLKELQE